MVQLRFFSNKKSIFYGICKKRKNLCLVQCKKTLKEKKKKYETFRTPSSLSNSKHMKR